MIAHAIRQWRFWLAAIMLSGLFLVLLGRVAMLQLIDVDGTVTFLQGQGDARTLRTETVLANRGMITDRHGQPLAVSTPVKNIWVNPRELDFASPALKQLAKQTGYSERELRERLALYRDKQFAYLRRHLSPADADRVLALNIRGVYAEEEYRRFYPAGETASHLIGFTGNEGKGLEGVELGFDNWLQGINGSNQVIKDLYGRTIKTVSEIQQASPGKDLALSIDLRIQHVAYRALKEAVVKHRAEAGSAVVLDVATGEVLAMVNQPSFNPNNRAVMNPGSVRNRAVTDVFEPGSTVKPLTVLAALESGRFTPDTVIDTSPGYIRLNGKTLLDPVNYQKLDVTGVIVKSSQVGTSKIALALSQDQIHEVFYRLGLGQFSGIGFPGESTGVLPNRSRWSDIERANFAFGYGVSATALQLAQAYAVLASGGISVPVNLLKQQEAPIGRRIVDARHAEQLRQMLEQVTGSKGTAKKAQTEHYTVAGKTGTAHKVGSGGYQAGHYLSLFAGFAPADQPRIVTVVVVDDPKGAEYYGGEVAAPVFADIVAGSLRLLNVAPDKFPQRQLALAGGAR